MRQLLPFLLLGLLAPCRALAADDRIAEFARDDEIRDVQLSPDGQYLAESRIQQGHDFLAVLHLPDRVVVNAFDLGAERRLARYTWVGSARIVMSFAEKRGSLASPRLTGELMAINADGRHGAGQTYLFGYRAAQADTAPGYLSSDNRAAMVIEAMPGDDRQALIEINDFPRGSRSDFGEVARLNVYTGTRDRVALGPARGLSVFLVDSSGYPRYAVAMDEQRTYTKAGPAATWQPLDPADRKTGEIQPLALSADDKHAYLLSSAAGENLCLVQQDLSSGDISKLSCDDAASVSNVVMSFDGKEPIAALYGGAPPWLRTLSTTNPDAAKLKSLQQAFPGQIVEPVSSTRDGSQVVLQVRSDRNPGDYYLFDPKTMHADLLASRRSAVQPEQMNEQRPVEFKARDGQSIHGLLTLPQGRDPKGLPLVVRPHGGPFDTFDLWGWDAEDQLLASYGYAVLQVNFRGSGGYGRAFVEAGRKQWDSVMIDDITDGTRWVIGQGIADARRACIYGASYGGYAALMSAVREPDLYRCAIGYAGVYDLNRWMLDSDVGESSRGRKFVDDFIGADASHLRAASPIAYLDRLKAAVMIVHGGNDTRVPLSQAEALRKALDARGYSYDWLVKMDEGHGFYEEKNRADLYQRLLAFLDRNIGSQAAQAHAEAALAPAVTVPAAAPAQ